MRVKETHKQNVTKKTINFLKNKEKKTVLVTTSD